MFYLLDERFILIYCVNIGFFSRLVNRIYSGFLFQLTDAALFVSSFVFLLCCFVMPIIWLILNIS